MKNVYYTSNNLLKFLTIFVFSRWSSSYLFEGNNSKPGTVAYSYSNIIFYWTTKSNT